MSSKLSEADLAAAGLQVLMGSELPVGLAVLDRELRYVQINATLARRLAFETKRPEDSEIADLADRRLRDHEAAEAQDSKY